MSVPLHLSLIALVLVNIAFVAITDVAARGGLMLMALATLGSPLPRRWTGKLWYHALWNVVVVAGFAFLVRHVMQGGLHLLLEDGLRLAALCQVHLVSTLHDRQRRDLLFFNSFLIPVVTSFLCFDLPFSLTLLAYVPILCVALHLSVIEAADGRRLRWRRAAAQGAWRGGLVIAGTYLAFFLVPRDFEHRGLMGEGFEWGTAQKFLEVDFDEEIELGKAGPVRVDERVVFTAVGEVGTLPEYWRGATNDRFTGRGWNGSGRVLPAWRWSRSGPQSWRRGAFEVDRRLLVHTRDHKGRVFAPMDAVEIRIDRSAALRPLPDGTLKAEGRTGFYQLGLARKLSAPGQIDLRIHGPLLEIRPGTLSRSARQSLLRYSRLLDAGTPLEARTEVIRARLSHAHEYWAPGDPRAVSSLDEFLEEGTGGHCEWFATALALALRLHEVPCRVVTGYRSSEFTDEGRSLVVRRKHAHAWVEYFHPRHGWQILDATPSGVGATQAVGGSRWKEAWGRMQVWWVEVTGFDESMRSNLWTGLVRSIREFVSTPSHLLAILGVLLAWSLLVLDRRRRATPACIRRLRTAARRNGTQWRDCETARELLSRVAQQQQGPERLRDLQQAVDELERARYAAEDRTELSRLERGSALPSAQSWAAARSSAGKFLLH